MSESKGKGRATGNEDGEPGVSEATPEPSLLSRVAASASGLTQNAFASPNGNELNERAATALSNAGKGQSSSKTPGQGSWAESSKLVPSSQANGSSALRSGQSEAHVKQSENDFSDFLNGIGTFVPSEDHAQYSHEETTFEQFWAGSQPGPQPALSKLPFTLPPLPAISFPAPITIVEQERHDGDEVLALLSGPSAPDEQFVAPEEDEEHYDWGLSKDQIIELRAMTKEMFPDSGVHTGIAAENPLNLVPMSNEYDKQEWFEQWEGVLNRYADEVWGGLLPLVKEARDEVDEMRSGASHGEQSKEPKALRRLNAILGHLQKR